MVSSMSLSTRVTEEHLRLKIFPYTMKDKARTWLNGLRPGSLATWTEVQNKFLENFFSTQKADALRDKIMQFEQQLDESFSEAWERFNNLLTQCPHHALPLLVLMRIFYKALTVYSKAAVNNYAGGSIRNMTPTECQNLFERLAIETQHSEVRGKRAGVYELNNSDTFAPRSQVDAIASKLDMLLAMNGRTIQQELCAICHVPGHATITCPQGVDFPEFVQEQANMMNSYNRNPRFDPYSNSYNPGFQAHPNFSWKNTQNQANPPTTTLEDMVRQLAISQQKLEAQVGQIAEALSRREAGKFPSQTEINPNTREQAMAITVCDEQQSRVATDFGEQKAVDYNLKISIISNKIVTYQAKEQPRCTVMNGWSDPDKLAPPVRPYVPPIPFSGHLRRNKEEVQSLQKTNPKRDVEPSTVQEKNELDENKVVQLTEECSAISQTKLPPKLKDPGSALKKTSVGIQLADRSIRYPKGVLEDVLVKIHGLIFPADFLVLDMRDCQGTLTMTNNEETVTFKPKAAQALYLKRDSVRICLFSHTSISNIFVCICLCAHLSLVARVYRFLLASVASIFVGLSLANLCLGVSLPVVIISRIDSTTA
ncbi:uncharacterized protein LOC119983418 [Tripterygium wilfordii]|uniref:uncharacterized protein LOC119983418 n=1 Tax=Tripterygium wilfordii TaxID=458696 RepID=UPI0018F7F117|nr:uncharacterized protein LOC119983418 [Tripterygium wilfordii]